MTGSDRRDGGGGLRDSQGSRGREEHAARSTAFAEASERALSLTARGDARGGVVMVQRNGGGRGANERFGLGSISGVLDFVGGRGREGNGGREPVEGMRENVGRSGVGRLPLLMMGRMIGLEAGR
jgi:hypothetical protein